VPSSLWLKKMEMAGWRPADIGRSRGI